MTDNKLTDNEIIKALSDCIESNKTKIFFITSENKIAGLKIADILDLINRQQADLEFAKNINALQMEELQKAQAEIERLKKGWKADVIETQTAKTEAIKEFAEKLKINYSKPLFAVGSYNEFIREVDNLVKEMVGDI